MRKHLVWVLALALALAVGVASVAIGAQVHTVKAKIAPAKQAKLRYGPASLDFTTASTCTEPGCKLNAANRVQIFIDDDVRVPYTRGLPQCDPARLANTTTAQAKARCGAAQVGVGKSIAYIGGDKDAAITGLGTTFNGPPRGGRPTLIVHNRIQAIASTVVLTGVYKKASGDFGTMLDVGVPPLPFGTALASFQNKLQKTWRSGGKLRSYLSARCFDRNRIWNFKGIDEYGGSDPPLTGNVQQRCTVRR